MTPSSRLSRHRRFVRCIRRLRQLSHRRWLVPATGLATATDSFLPVMPVQSLLVVLALLHPTRWLRTGLWFALGGTLGGAAMALALSHLGAGYAGEIVGGGAENGFAAGVAGWIRMHGPWALAVLALGPWPLRSAVIVCALGGASWQTIAIALATGRSISFPALAWLVGRRPAWLGRVRWFDRLRRTLDTASNRITPA